LLPLLNPTPASALTVEIQGTRLEIQVDNASCVEIAGSYPGLRIEASENGAVPRICYNNTSKVNSVTILDSSFISASPVRKDVVIKFEHEFPAGINGKIMMRAKLKGFFSSPNGVGIPSGDKLSFDAFFNQAGHDDAIAEPFNVAVGDDIDSAMFDYFGKEQYLISGPRKLRGIITVYFSELGHKLTVADKSGLLLDTGSTMADKLETMEPKLDEAEEPAGEESPSGSAKPSAPAAPAKLPTPAPAQKPAASGTPKKPAAAPVAEPKPELPAELPKNDIPFTLPQ
jgi:hypothetical protein